MKTIAKWSLIAMVTIFFLSWILRTCGDADNVIQKEFAPSALLKKYEYFKDMSAAIDKKRADIEMYREELASLTVTDKDDKFYKEQRKSELIGIISIHNSLCAEYNSAMSKFNYRFTNAGDLPQSNLEPLPREYKPYILSLK